MTLKCPLCDYKTKSLHGLRLHALKMHKSSYCPVCGRFYKKILEHLANFSNRDEEHKKIYVLFCRKIGKKVLIDWAIKVFEIE